jgi:general secretion pathway protein F
MAGYQVRGLTAHGQLVVRQVQADSDGAASRMVEQSGLHVIDVKPLMPRWRSSQTNNHFDIALFAQELMALLSAGLSLVETLETLQERQQSRAQDCAVMAELLRHMREGKSFSRALACFPGEFPDLFVASIAASEQTGEMVDALRRYLRYHEQVSGIRQKIISASIYPAMLLVVGVGVALFLLCFLVPRFSHVYEGMDTQLPLASRLLMQWGMFASQHVVAVVIGMTMLVVGGVSLIRSVSMQRALLNRLQRGRLLGGQLRLMQLSRFYRSVGLLLRGGVPVSKAFDMTRPMLDPVLQQSLIKAMGLVSEGISLSTSLKDAGLTTEVAWRLLRAGERNGQLAEMMERSAEFHDVEVAQWIDRFARIFEPLLMLLIGGVIGGIVVLLYLPIFELAGSVR